MEIMVCAFLLRIGVWLEILQLSVPQEKTSMLQYFLFRFFSLAEFPSANDLLALEVEAGGTSFEVSSTSQNAFNVLFDGDRWMIFRNTITGVLHWDFVSKCSFYRIQYNNRSLMFMTVRHWSFYQFPSRRLAVCDLYSSFHITLLIFSCRSTEQPVA